MYSIEQEKENSVCRFKEIDKEISVYRCIDKDKQISVCRYIKARLSISAVGQFFLVRKRKRKGRKRRYVKVKNIYL